jgi:hypothetical protein
LPGSSNSEHYRTWSATLYACSECGSVLLHNADPGDDAPFWTIWRTNVSSTA